MLMGSAQTEHVHHNILLHSAEQIVCTMTCYWVQLHMQPSITTPFQAPTLAPKGDDLVIIMATGQTSNVIKGL